MKTLLKWAPLLMLVGLILAARPAVAKGPTNLIRIVGPDAVEPIEITDPEILNRFDPWAGQFIGTGGPLDFPPPVHTPYEVIFYLENSRGELDPAYMFYYYLGRSGSPGYIYLPGEGEPYYRLNIGTIIRGSADGQWHRSMPTWDALMSERLPTVTVAAVASPSRAISLAFFGAAAGVLLLL
ncbi:MAG: hypothetical protein R3300_14265, partial [Candidatus Promineifilaceae bacterium]|nr:hypothetical protein [Candidatus Promineifilaceae bacterium]